MTIDFVSETQQLTATDRAQQQTQQEAARRDAANSSKQAVSTEASTPPLQERVRSKLTEFQRANQWGEKQYITEYKNLLVLKKEIESANKTDISESELSQLQQEIDKAVTDARQELLTKLLGGGFATRSYEEKTGHIVASETEEAPLIALAKELGQQNIIKQLGITSSDTYSQIIAKTKAVAEKLPDSEKNKIKEFGQSLQEVAKYLATKEKYSQDPLSAVMLRDLYNAGAALSSMADSQKIGQEEQPITWHELSAKAQDPVFIHSLTEEKRAKLLFFLTTGKTSITPHGDLPHALQQKADESQQAYVQRITTFLTTNEDRRLDLLQHKILESIDSGKAAKNIRAEAISGAYAFASQESRGKTLDAIGNIFGEDGVEKVSREIEAEVTKLQASGQEITPEIITREIAQLVGKFQQAGQTPEGKHVLAQLYNKNDEAQLICVTTDYVLAPLLVQQIEKLAETNPAFKGFLFGAEATMVNEEGHIYLVMVAPDGTVWKIDPTNTDNPVEKIDAPDAEHPEKNSPEGDRLRAKFGKDSENADDPLRVYKQLEAAMLYNLQLGKKEDQTEYSVEEKKQFIDQVYRLDPNNFLIVIAKAGVTEDKKEKQYLLDKAKKLNPLLTTEQIDSLLQQGVEIKAITLTNPDADSISEKYKRQRDQDSSIEAIKRYQDLRSRHLGTTEPITPDDPEFNEQIAFLRLDRDAAQEAMSSLEKAYGAIPTPGTPAGDAYGEVVVRHANLDTALATIDTQVTLYRGGAVGALAVIDTQMGTLLGNLNVQYLRNDNLGLFLPPTNLGYSTIDRISEFSKELNALLPRVHNAVQRKEVKDTIEYLSAQQFVLQGKEKAYNLDPKRIMEDFQNAAKEVEDRGIEVNDLRNQEIRNSMDRCVARFSQFVSNYEKGLLPDPRRTTPPTPWGTPGFRTQAEQTQLDKYYRQAKELKDEDWARPWLYEANRIIGTNFSQNSAAVEEYQKRIKNDRLFTLMNVEHVGLAMRLRAQIAEKYLRNGERMTPETGAALDNETKARLKEEVSRLAAQFPTADISIDDTALDRAASLAKFIDGNMYFTAKRGAKARLPQTYEQYSKQSQSTAVQAFDPFGPLELLEGVSPIGKALLKKVGSEKMKRMYYMSDWVTYGTNREAMIVALNARGLYDFNLYVRLRHQFESVAQLKGWAHETLEERETEEKRLRDIVLAGGYKTRAEIEEQVHKRLAEWDKGRLQIFQEKTRLGDSYYGDGHGHHETLEHLLEAIANNHLDQISKRHGTQLVYYREDIIKRIAKYEPTTFMEQHFWDNRDLNAILLAAGGGSRDRGVEIYTALDDFLGQLRERDYFTVKQEIKAGTRGYNAGAPPYGRRDPLSELNGLIASGATHPSGLSYIELRDMYIQLRNYMGNNKRASELATATVLNGKAVRYNRNVITETDIMWEIFDYSNQRMPGTGKDGPPLPDSNAAQTIGNNSLANATGRVIQGYNFGQAVAKVFSSPQSYEAVTKLHGSAGWLDRSEEEEYIRIVEEGRLKLFRYSPLLIKEDNIEKMYAHHGLFANIYVPFFGPAERHKIFGVVPIVIPGVAKTEVTVMPLPDWALKTVEKVNDISRLHIIPFSEARRLLGKKGLKLNPTEMEAEIMDMVAHGLITPEDAHKLNSALTIIWLLRGIPWLQIIAAAALMSFINEMRDVFSGK